MAATAKRRARSGKACIQGSSSWITSAPAALSSRISAFSAAAKSMASSASSP
jgi:hypothetical protein